ncbi:hypothetical protein [Mucilaginibacter sp. CSA2-8R]|uniref:hypothetical protein n=1 Tax=Mucilaginibacter sp. CSA2-8R TaxID=3141542 RepID=UPI00315CACAC
MKPFFRLLAIPVVVMACTTKPKPAAQNSSTTTIDSSVAVTKTATSPKRQPAAEWLIVPGKSVGKVTIDENADSVLIALGQPNLTDGAMGSALLTWLGKNGDSNSRVSVFTQRDMGGPDETVSRVKQIRVTSPQFKTAEGIGAGATLTDLSAHYSIKAVDKYKQLKVYDDLQHGIAFDVDSLTNRCVAISVHTPFNRNAAHMNLR